MVLYWHEDCHIALFRDASPGRYVCLIQFNDAVNAAAFYQSMNGKSFSSFFVRFFISMILFMDMSLWFASFAAACLEPELPFGADRGG